MLKKNASIIYLGLPLTQCIIGSVDESLATGDVYGDRSFTNFTETEH